MHNCDSEKSPHIPFCSIAEQKRDLCRIRRQAAQVVLILKTIFKNTSVHSYPFFRIRQVVCVKHQILKCKAHKLNISRQHKCNCTTTKLRCRAAACWVFGRKFCIRFVSPCCEPYVWCRSIMTPTRNLDAVYDVFEIYALLRALCSICRVYILLDKVGERGPNVTQECL